MNATIRATVRQDLHALRWFLPIWILSLAVWVIGKNNWFGQTHEYSSAATLVINLGTIAVWFFVFGRLLFNHAPADPRAEWHTRPLSRTLVAGTKIATALVILVVLPATAMALFNSQSELSSLARFSEEWRAYLPVLTVNLASFFFVGSLCRSTRQLLVVIPILFLCVSVAISLLNIVNDSVPSLRFSEEGIPVATSVYCVGLFALVVRQFQRPRLGRSIGGGVFVLLAVAALTQVFPHHNQRLLTDGVALRILEISPTEDRPTDFTLSVQGLNENSAWKFLNIAGDGNYYQHKPVTGKPNFLLETPGLAAQLKLSGYKFDGLLPTTASLVLKPRKTKIAQIPIIDGGANLTFIFDRYDARNLGELSIAAETVLENPDGLSATVSRLSYGTDNRIIHVEVKMAAKLTRKSGIDPKLYFLLIDDHEKQAAFLTSRSSRATQGIWGRETSVSLVLPNSETPIEDLRLMIVQLRQTGRMFLKPTSTPTTD